MFYRFLCFPFQQDDFGDPEKCLKHELESRCRYSRELQPQDVCKHFKRARLASRDGRPALVDAEGGDAAEGLLRDAAAGAQDARALLRDVRDLGRVRECGIIQDKNALLLLVFEKLEKSYKTRLGI